jgi:preprotein translocase subunit SecY
MENPLKNLFAVTDLRNRILFTLALLGVYRIGAHITVPGVNREAIAIFADQFSQSPLGLYNVFTGGNLQNATIFALGVMPYISASIILQLLTVVWPYLERISKEGELGRRKITQYTRYLTLALAIVQSAGISFWLEQNTDLAGGLPLVSNPGIGFKLLCVLTLTTGTMFIMWLGEQITERGVGNGMSLLIFAGIIEYLPTGVFGLLNQLQTGQVSVLFAVALVAFMVALIAAIVFVERAHRRITVQYAKRVVGRRQYGGASTHIPLKVNTGGVIPVIFASSILAFAQMLPTIWPATQPVADELAYGMPLYALLYVVGIIFFCYFYTAIIFNPDDVAENMRKYGGFIPGIRPGKRTAEYIDTILSRITLVGSIYLAAVALLPELLASGLNVGRIPFIGEDLDAVLPRWFTQGAFGVAFAFGGTSILIVVGVAMDTVQQVESQLIMRHYDGFMKKTRIRGRRG